MITLPIIICLAKGNPFNPYSVVRNRKSVDSLRMMFNMCLTKTKSVRSVKTRVQFSGFGIIYVTYYQPPY